MALPADASPEILRADPRARRRALAILVVGGLLGLLAIEWLLPWARGRVAQAVYEGGLPQSAVCKSVLAFLMLIAASVAAFGVYVWRFGRRVVREERFPPTGVNVVRDTRVLNGRPARLLGHAQAINGALLVALAIAMVALCAYGFIALSFRG
ncbi:MAG TPA: hypothetical protein VFO62_02750 [Candidatus Binatia bacterium]|nr:hypothetical protein [Candidatus Binatia bacterium]